jgi:hypothetical protein
MSGPVPTQPLAQCITTIKGQTIGTGKGSNIECNKRKTFNTCELSTDGICEWKHNPPTQKEIKESMRTQLKSYMATVQTKKKLVASGFKSSSCGSGPGSANCIKAKACKSLGSGKGSFVGSNGEAKKWDNGSGECMADYPKVEQYGFLPINGGGRKTIKQKNTRKNKRKSRKKQSGGSGSGSGSGSDSEGSGWTPEGYNYNCPFPDIKKCEGKCKSFDRDKDSKGNLIYGRVCSNPKIKDKFMCELKHRGKQLCRWEYQKKDNEGNPIIRDMHPIQEVLGSVGYPLNPDYIDSKGMAKAGCAFANSPLWASACGMNLSKSACLKMGYEEDPVTKEKITKCQWKPTCVADPNGPRTLENYQRCATHITKERCGKQQDGNYDKASYQCVWEPK